MPFGLGKSADEKLQEEIFNLKMTTKTLDRQAKKAEQEHNKEKLKVKKAIEENKADFARVYAETAIRKRNESLRLMRMSAQLSSVASKMKTASNVKENMKTMAKVNTALGTAMQSMNLEKIQGVMDKFEITSDRLDVMTNVMEGSLDSATASSNPTNQVNALIQTVADEHALDVTTMMSQLDGPASAPLANPNAIGQSQLPVTEESSLEQRLAGLRN